MNYSNVFHFDNSKENFNDLYQEGNFTFWYARDFMVMLGYKNYESFSKAINKAMTACMTLEIPVLDNFVQQKRILEGQSIPDYQLSRFACYLIAMNADVTKKEVAQAQAFFVTIAESFRQYIEEPEEIERLLIREEISEHEKTLNSTAKRAGVKEYGLFQNAGYRGMYNMNLKQLKQYKGIKSSRTPLDFMGKEELAANLFRVTQTESKIRNENIKGQNNAEIAAENVGRKVRQTMLEISGTVPEQLPKSEDIKKVKSALKSSHTDFKKIDKGNRDKN
jgi:DNA-damage-inducible protein D